MSTASDSAGGTINNCIHRGCDRDCPFIGKSGHVLYVPPPSGAIKPPYVGPWGPGWPWPMGPNDPENPPQLDPSATYYPYSIRTLK